MLRVDLIVPGGRRGRRPASALAKYRAAIAALKPAASRPKPVMRARRAPAMSKAQYRAAARAANRRAFLARGMTPPVDTIESRAQEFYMAR